ncbi:MAG: hypothetical protein LBE22_01010, partial [Azoarcus sp.]|nr:hypothetical protein [Azoarcus sp.]
TPSVTPTACHLPREGGYRVSAPAARRMERSPDGASLVRAARARVDPARLRPLGQAVFRFGGICPVEAHRALARLR